MAIKKAFEGVVAFLQDNQDKKVKTLLPAIEEMCSGKSGGKGGGAKFKKDAEGNVTHVFCYYHKMWEDVSVVEYGAKTGSPTGLNNMCKEGTSAWTKQDRQFKKSSTELLDKLASGEILAEDIDGLREDYATAKAAVVPREDGHGVSDEDFKA